tara:strand:+ start:1969 stop:2313 length:345 start_codon:yes stop_codon:yes gene_type:complete
MDHQDFREIIIRGKPKQINNKKIVSRGNNVDLHKIKIENEQENFKILTIPIGLCKEIAQARNLKKLTQKELAQKLGIQSNIYNTIENGKATYDGKTKQLVNKIQNILGTKFSKK